MCMRSSASGICGVVYRITRARPNEVIIGPELTVVFLYPSSIVEPPAASRSERSLKVCVSRSLHGQQAALHIGQKTAPTAAGQMRSLTSGASSHEPTFLGVTGERAVLPGQLVPGSSMGMRLSGPWVCPMHTRAERERERERKG